MSSFDVLHRNLDLSKGIFLEASAGTGKTFAIENIVARLLLDRLPLEKCLVVTFTHAATNDLKERIHTHLHSLIRRLEQDDPGPFDYLMPLLEGDEEQRQEACLLLKRALTHFSQAFISTIHGFCSRLLSEHAFLAKKPLSHRNLKEDPLLLSELVKDCLLNLQQEDFSPAQMAVVLRGRPLFALVDELIPWIQSRLPITPLASFKDLHARFSSSLKQFPRDFHECLLKFAPFITGAQDRQGNLKPIWEKQLQQLELLFTEGCSLQTFDQLLWHDPPFLSLLNHPLKKKAPPFPESLQLARTLLTPLQEARSYPHLITQLAQKCRAYKTNYPQLQDPDQLLFQMQAALKIPEFFNAVEQQFEVAIIDEFQDTDPLQWEIFWSLFHKKRLFLVGDPKQSIYAFRQADLYTYLHAKEKLPEDSFALLTTNFRSQPQLIEALNALFCHNWMDLPKEARFLEVPAVQAAPSKVPLLPHEASLTWMVAKGNKGKGERWPKEEMEEQLFFPYIAKEIVRLTQEGLSWSDFACLVKDRFQKERLATFFATTGVPYTTNREQTLLQTESFTTLKSLIYAAHTQETQAYRTALSSPLFSLKASLFLSAMDKEIETLQALFVLLKNQGLIAFMEGVTQLSFFAASPLELHYWWRLGDLLLQELRFTHFTPPLKLFSLLCAWENLPNQEKTDLLLPQQESIQAVKILTLHGSKGLEFPVVFSLALASRTPQEELLIPNEEGTALVLAEPNTPHFDLFLREKDAEKMRQLYVALTRAKEKAYLAIAIDEEGSLPLPGQASPAELFLQRQPHFSFDAPPPHIAIEILTPQTAPQLTSNRASISFTPPARSLRLPPLQEELLLLSQSPIQKALLRAIKMFGINKLQKVPSLEAMEELVPHLGAQLWQLFCYCIEPHLPLNAIPVSAFSLEWEFHTHFNNQSIEGSVDLLIQTASHTHALSLATQDPPLQLFSHLVQGLSHAPLVSLSL